MSMLNRRSFVSLAALAAVTPMLPAISHERISSPALPKPIRLNFNENPLGPTDKALAAMRLGAERTGRYHYGEQLRLINIFAEQNNIPADYVQAFSGSREALQHCISAFTSKDNSLVMPFPSYDTVAESAQIKGVQVREVALRADGSHDISSMLSADKKAGLFYICNPNNPTGSVTHVKDIEIAATHKPAGSVLVIDEAYIHFSDQPHSLALATERNDVLVLRTFSKLYGMAGARLGLAIGHPDLLRRIELFGGGNFVPMPAALGGIASLEDTELVPARRRLNTHIREKTVAALQSAGLACTNSQANCFMVDTGHPAVRMIEALEKRGVLIGRPWPSWPTWVRISIGTEQEMDYLQQAFLEEVQKTRAISAT